MTNVDFRDAKIFEALQDESHPEYQNVYNNLIFLALCHTIVVEMKGEEIVYNASSPDELALANFARFCGFTFVGIDDNNDMMVNVRGRVRNYNLLYVLEFNSTRKRASVILRDDQGKILLLCKGADTFLFERINSGNSQNIDKTKYNLNEYGKIGLRTLALAWKEIPQNQF